ncbi:MAG: hypothetical protein HQL84_02750 [Magnetococcales bacterium]|nr:hypothetical protein [Magnetococcales bacterium]MBF0148945.1 hypothetical protein [Magnetococcales bacterium]MBF0347856.1 hypothetical protein [Magnetococcales bacterium]MBF0631185.1 hypothetical protein [Magnetococcales bacterium]
MIYFELFIEGQDMCQNRRIMANSIKLMNQNWNFILSLLPANWEALAKETGAVRFSKKNVNSLGDLMRIYFLHVAAGYSLSESSARARLAGMGEMSGVALMPACLSIGTIQPIWKGKGIKQVQRSGKDRWSED